MEILNVKKNQLLILNSHIKINGELIAEKGDLAFVQKVTKTKTTIGIENKKGIDINFINYKVITEKDFTICDGKSRSEKELSNLTVKSIKESETYHGISYMIKLNSDNTEIGYIENDGRGGCDFFRAKDEKGNKIFNDALSVAKKIKDKVNKERNLKEEADFFNVGEELMSYLGFQYYMLETFESYLNKQFEYFNK